MVFEDVLYNFFLKRFFLVKSIIQVQKKTIFLWPEFCWTSVMFKYFEDLQEDTLEGLNLRRNKFRNKTYFHCFPLKLGPSSDMSTTGSSWAIVSAVFKSGLIV